MISVLRMASGHGSVQINGRICRSPVGSDVYDVVDMIVMGIATAARTCHQQKI